MQKVRDNKQITKVRPVWEYLIEDSTLEITDLNQLGLSGWELISVHMYSKLYFRRQIVQVKDKN